MQGVKIMAVIKRMEQRIKKIPVFFRRHKMIIGIIIAIILFPVCIGLIYNIPCRQIVSVEAGDLLAFYGTGFGIFFSFLTYREEKKKERLSRTDELRPKLLIEVEQETTYSRLFNIKIKKLSNNPLQHIYLYTEYVLTELDKENNLKILYCQTIEESKKYEKYADKCIFEDILDNDGYPQYIHIMCDDIEGNCWDCCYNKINDCGSIYYHLGDIGIL